MVPVRDVAEVMTAIQTAKDGATAFCTNLFPVQRKLQAWIDRAELLSGVTDGSACFLRQDRDFWHFYFSASNTQALAQALSAFPELLTNRVTVDLVGAGGAVEELSAVFESAGFGVYTRLFRMSRIAPAAPEQTPAEDSRIGFAGAGDGTAILDLLLHSFDRYAEQLPQAYEIEAAVDERQCLVAKCDGALAGVLFFETQGFTSTVRYWLVADRFRSQRVGGALMHHYFALHRTVRRFVLWVIADNENAIKRYRHFGYAPDGLVDLVMANGMIPR
jgi:GNAT superfamily N-acetyltransferase